MSALVRIVSPCSPVDWVFGCALKCRFSICSCESPFLWPSPFSSSSSTGYLPYYTCTIPLYTITIHSIFIQPSIFWICALLVFNLILLDWFSVVASQTVYLNNKYDATSLFSYSVNGGYMNYPVCMHYTDSLTDIKNNELVEVDS